MFVILRFIFTFYIFCYYFSFIHSKKQKILKLITRKQLLFLTLKQIIIFNEPFKTLLFCVDFISSFVPPFKCLFQMYLYAKNQYDFFNIFILLMFLYNSPI